MLRKIKQLVKKYGIAKVTVDLDYRSTGTIRSWIKNNKVPVSAIRRVKEYLK